MGGAEMPYLGGAGAPAFVVQVYQHSAAGQRQMGGAGAPA